MQDRMREPRLRAIHEPRTASPLRERLLRGLIIGVIAAVVLAVVGALNTQTAPFPLRLAYWLTVVLPGSIIGLFMQSAVAGMGTFSDRRWLEILVVAVLVAIPHTFIVVVASMLMFGLDTLTVGILASFGGIVLMFSLVLTSINYLTSKEVDIANGEPRAMVAPPAPLPSSSPPLAEPNGVIPAALAERMPPRLSNGRLIALEAEDHYLRIHTDLGHDIILMRMADAVGLLDALPGARVHRSWWVARSAVEGSSSANGRTTLQLATGIEAPVSRSIRPALAALGWFL